MTARGADPLVVRPQPTHDDAVPNANGIFAEALVRLAHITGTEADRRLAEDRLAALVAVAAPAPLGHTSVLNALDLHLRGLSILVIGRGADALREAALRLPYLERSVRALREGETLEANHSASALASSSDGPQALVCAGMRCSLPVGDPRALVSQAREMLRASAGET
jgi:uncharacterized protein